MTTAATDGREWVMQAECRNVDPELFHSTHAEELRAAKRLCRHCPVIQECLADALNRHDGWGVWGGLDSRERNRLYRKHLAAR